MDIPYLSEDGLKNVLIRTKGDLPTEDFHLMH